MSENQNIVRENRTQQKRIDKAKDEGKQSEMLLFCDYATNSFIFFHLTLSIF